MRLFLQHFRCDPTIHDRHDEEREHERAEQTAKAEYIERYGDLSTWDDRQQQIHFPYTINTLHETDPRSGDVGVFVLYLVEAGLTVKGVTVALARDKLQTTLGRPFKLPDDILDLKLA